MDRQQIGRDAEQRALNYLIQKGLKLINRNYHCRFGEIDLIMQDKEQLVFIEVRSRRHSHWGGAGLSVDFRKQKKLIKTASYFLSQQKSSNLPVCRFDVIAFEANKDNGSGDSCPIWYKDAFRPEATF
ncbi:YraN family protein [uncultured Amphritea sp.]|mgnify:FL=1|uniref:YraN family protein n=1 Tax=Amphritea sp. TaxID=1872502 RepID=UPI001D336308|nr:YraN family protein [uncultured Amphritea sp.]MBR9867876.1 YraN family protein [Oceanospirillales bacterium]MBR9888949.1 YraN family protein [Oceanospirillales bacterium]